MYCITDEQIEYILNDIRRNGVEMEDLQFNLLDHICCIMELGLKDTDDFEAFYHRTVKQFYKNNLREIEEETIDLLTFKNYYAMKKLLITSGAFSVAAFIFGSLFKMMAWPGAAALLTLGIGTFSLLFLPLMFVLKSREVSTAGEKFVIAIASTVGILFSLAILFIVMHWPGANVMLFSSIGGAAFLLLPAYFFTGIRRPEKKLNTIIMSIILVGIIGLQFSLVRLRPTASQLRFKMISYAKGEDLLKRMQSISAADKQATEINTICEQLKSIVLQKSIGMSSVPANYEQMHLALNEGGLGTEFEQNGMGVQLVINLRNAVAAYNASKQGNADLMLPTAQSVLEAAPAKLRDSYTNISFLSSITQLQMYLAIAESKQSVAVK